MIHLTNHPYAFLKNGIVQDIITMADHESTDFLDMIAVEREYDSYASCCEHGEAHVGGDLFNGRFRHPNKVVGFVWDDAKKDWVPPIPKIPDTEETIYRFNLESWSWVGVPRADLAPFIPPTE